MDTKSKSSKVIGSIILTAVIIIFAGVIVNSYDYFEKVVERETKYPYKQEWFSGRLSEYAYSLYVDVAEERAGKELQPSEVYLGVKSKEVTIDSDVKIVEDREDDYIEDVEETTAIAESYTYEYNDYRGYSIEEIAYEFNSQMDDISDAIVKYNHNLKYQVIDNKSGKEITSYDWTFSEKTKAEYDTYVTIVFDEDGNVTIKDGFAMDEDGVTEQIDYFRQRFRDNYGSKALISQINDVTFHFAVPKELQRYDHIYYMSGKEQGAFRIYENSGFLIMLAGIVGIIMLLTFVLSSKKLCKLGTGMLSKVPCEVASFLAIADITLIFYMCQIIHATYTGHLAKEFVQLGITDKIVPILNIGLWIGILGTIAILTLAIKQLFVKGLKRYCIENVLVIRMISWCIRKFKNFISKITAIDVNDTANKYLVKILSVNFIIVTALCLMWFFGVFVLVIYTILLFFFLQKRVNALRENYDSIVTITDSLAKGNLNVTESRDLGVFEPIKENLTKIQGGFKKAVEEEVKSQNMKTELITNVSHDLKTPLTAIITYIDLLKNEEINEEERKSYIETLDKKSQRLKQLIEDLFEVSKANSGNMEVELATVDVLSLIKQVEYELAEKLEEAGIEINIRSNEEKVMLELDGQKSYRVFENLFVNIIKYAMPNRKAYVDVIVSESITQIEVKNMSKEELDFDISEITERFVRGDKSRNSEGAGLGLAIVKSLVELQGGRFEIVTDGDLFKAIITFGRDE
ncbi:sensor histidine kinase [Anaerosporobacter sp.]|uniref:sensor histidine kinase n=1 Tax=Anaerosporobacter sp. TaxID=1872529 RepID=UPI00286F1CDA|nr:HAMP domain-containing sensor histidine kinase [Anaerosporobacter sp.]